jgi:hypothetical protein
MVRGEIKEGLRNSNVRGKTFGDTKVDYVKDFMRVRRPVSGLASGEMSEVVGFHGFKKDTTTRCYEAGTPLGVFGIVIVAREEPGSESSIEVFELLLADCVFLRKIN